MKINKSLVFSAVILLIAVGSFVMYFTNFKPAEEKAFEIREAQREQETLEQAKKIKYVALAMQKVKVDLALTAEERNQGLSGREKLEENEGMLFVFDKPGNHAFWMKDMNFPIDIIWIDGDFNMVIYIKKDARPEAYPETYAPGEDVMGDARYVLEVPAGFSEKNNLKVGDRVGFIGEDNLNISN